MAGNVKSITEFYLVDHVLDANHVILAGQPVLTKGPLSVHYGPKGNTTHWVLSCAAIGPLITFYNYIVQFGASGTFLGCDYGNDGVTGAFEKQLEISMPGLAQGLESLSELYFDSWELLSNESSDTIFANPLIVGSSSGWMTANDIDVLSQLTLSGGTVSQAVANADANVPNNKPHTTPTDARSLQIIYEILKGQTEYEKPTYVLRHTSYCSAGANYNTSTAFTQCRYSPAQLLSECGSGWTYNLPPRLYTKIANIPQEYAPANEASYYQWSWLKKITREPILSNFVCEVSTEYELGLWSNLRYGHR